MCSSATTASLHTKHETKCSVIFNIYKDLARLFEAVTQGQEYIYVGRVSLRVWSWTKGAERVCKRWRLRALIWQKWRGFIA